MINSTSHDIEQGLSESKQQTSTSVSEHDLPDKTPPLAAAAEDAPPPTKAADAALSLLAANPSSSAPDKDKSTHNLLRKIDLHIMPLICLIYFLQYIDQNRHFLRQRHRPLILHLPSSWKPLPTGSLQSSSSDNYSSSSPPFA
ncbi:hypothetical protein Slin15195_G099680 [Septoria linicola]|uniref:Uncharacterized protein n=1 Tax=Septoria linicola TaxID=215465 RepID=A0A9Q9AX50_9PEZI|nr:hypothetical protein Slin15195_G099680 [Septoria linicola]